MLTVGSTRDNRGWVVDRIGFIAGKSMKTADDVYDAMLSRGFTGAMPSLVTLRTTARDWVWIAASVGACALVLGLDRVLVPR
jgi:energy-coupling factor transporter transmembrane protein EcfT